MSYFIVDQEGNGGDFGTITGLQDMDNDPTKPPELEHLLNTGTISEEQARALADAVRDHPLYHYMSPLLDKMTGQVILTDGCPHDVAGEYEYEDDDEPDDAVECDFSEPELTRYEKRMNFSKIKDQLDTGETKAQSAIKKILKSTLTDTIQWCNANEKTLDAEAVKSFTIKSGESLKSAFRQLFLAAWHDGRDTSVGELPGEIAQSVSLKQVKQFVYGDPLFEPNWLRETSWPRWHAAVQFAIGTGFTPTDAIKAFDARAWMITGVIDTSLQTQVRQELFQFLAGGKTMSQTIDDIRKVFEPYVGDPEKILPSGASNTPEDILQAYRIENIVRTESTWAYNQGRLAVADASSDYVIGFQYSAIIDERTTELCRTAGGAEKQPALILRANDSRTIQLTPPNHFQCRSMYAFVTTDDYPVEWSSDGEVNKVLEMVPKGFK